MKAFAAPLLLSINFCSPPNTGNTSSAQTYCHQSGHSTLKPSGHNEWKIMLDSESRKVIPVSGKLSTHNFARALTFLQHQKEGENHFTVNTQSGSICIDKNTHNYFGYEADDKHSYTGALKARIKTAMFFGEVESKDAPPTLLPHDTNREVCRV